MLKLSGEFINRNILSLRLGGQVATAIEPIINPNNLKIEGWFCEDIRSKARLILQPISIREMINEGFIIDDIDELVPLEDSIRLRKVVDLGFNLIGKQVVTDAKRKLGKVGDYALNPDDFVIQKLYVNQTIVKDFSGGGKVIDRTQIVEITDSKIIVRDTLDKLSATAPIPAAEPV